MIPNFNQMKNNLRANLQKIGKGEMSDLLLWIINID